MPASKREAPRFKTIQQLQLDYAPVHITQYESTRTGMRLAVVDKKGPKVEGEFALATEINDNSGAPHTLEHLVFMGSKSYKYTGLLDRLSSRAFSTTNAGTATDYTSYSLKTAGWEGFSHILPVNLRLLFLPPLLRFLAFLGRVLGFRFLDLCGDIRREIPTRDREHDVDLAISNSRSVGGRKGIRD